MIRMIRYVIGFCAVALLVIATSACNTMHGAGKDIESVGNAISNSTQ